jgi:hypothetical protein
VIDSFPLHWNARYRYGLVIVMELFRLNHTRGSGGVSGHLPPKRPALQCHRHPRPRWLFLTIFGLAVHSSLRGDIQMTNQTLTANVSPYGRVSLPGSVSLFSSNTRFGNFSGNLLVSYWVRTGTGSSGSITIKALSDFSPSGGPTVGSVTYTCSGATLGTPCSGSQALSTQTQSPVVTVPGGACTGGGGACSFQDPNTVLLQFVSPSKPQFKTGTFSVQFTITISTP